MQNQLQNFSYPRWGVNFKYPAQWRVEPHSEHTGGSEKLVVRSHGENTMGAPTVVIELKEASLAHDMEHLLNSVMLRINTEMQDLELVNKATQQVRGEARGVLVLKFNAEGKQQVAQIMLLTVAGNQYLEVTASRQFKGPHFALS